jgi:hypothetical protein
VHADEARGEAGVEADGAADGVAHNVLSLWAGVLVESNLQRTR